MSASSKALSVGQHSIARAVLEAMGYPDAPVPERVQNTLLPGIICQWQMRAVAPKEERLTEKTVSALAPDATWVTLTLPGKEPLTGDENLWLDDCRPLGAAIWVKKTVGGQTEQYIGVATLEAPAAKKMYFNIGAGLSAVWLNGKKILEASGLRGWHLGRESVVAEVQPGKNTLVIEVGDNFFLSVTEKPFWE